MLTVFALGYQSGLRSPEVDISLSWKIYDEFKAGLVAACQAEPTKLFATTISELE